MADLAGYLGGFTLTSDSGVSVVDETLGTADGSSKVFTTAHSNVDYKDITVQGSDTSVTTYVFNKDFYVNPEGRIIFKTAPTSDTTIKASYDYYPNLVNAGGFFSWSIDLNVDTLEVTNFDTGGWRDFIAGLTGWTGSADRHWRNSIIATRGKRAIFRFYLDAANSDYYIGWGVLDSIGESTGVDTLVDDSLGITGNEMLFHVKK